MPRIKITPPVDDDIGLPAVPSAMAGAVAEQPELISDPAFVAAAATADAAAGAAASAPAVAAPARRGRPRKNGNGKAAAAAAAALPPLQPRSRKPRRAAAVLPAAEPSIDLTVHLMARYKKGSCRKTFDRSTFVTIKDDAQVLQTLSELLTSWTRNWEATDFQDQD